MWRLAGLRRAASAAAATTTMTTSARYIHGDMRHQNTDYDNTRIPWDFTTASYEKIHNEILPKFPRGKRISATIPLLHLAQQQQGGFIPVTAMYKIAKICEVPPMHVFETVTFYSMFNRHPVGKYHIQFCRTTPCMLCGVDELMDRTMRYLNVRMHGTTSDGLITIGEMECLGACVNAPMLVVSDYSNPPNFSYDYVEDLTWESIKVLIEDLRSGKAFKIGPQRPDRKYAEPAGGRTSIFFKQPPGPYCRDIDAKPEAPPKKPMPTAPPSATSAPQAESASSDLMSAIQRVLAEHNVADARFVLELPSQRAAGTPSTVSNAGGTARGAPTAIAATGPPMTSANELLVGMGTTPATAPPVPPAHHSPPPRARKASAPPSPSASVSPPRSTPQTPARGEPADTVTSLELSIGNLKSTARPAEKGSTSDVSSRNEGEAVVHASADTAAAATPPSTDDIAHLQRLSQEVADEVRAADSQARREEVLQGFVGRSVLLDDRRRRQTAPSGSSFCAVPLFPSRPAADTTATTASGARPSYPSLAVQQQQQKQHLARVPSLDSNTMEISATTPRTASHRRSVVLVSSPPGADVHPSAAGRTSPSTSPPVAGSLPSLVAVKRSAVPGKTPVFSILNKESSRLLETGERSAANNNTSGSSGHGMGTSSPRSPASPQPSPHTSACSHQTHLSQQQLHHHNSGHGPRTSSVAVMSDDRVPPSPVFQPLTGSAAEELASRHPSILVLSSTSSPPPPSQLPPRNGTAAASTAGAAPSSEAPADAATATPPSTNSAPSQLLWTEQSRENTQRALQLQSHSRLSQTTGENTAANKGSNPSTGTALSASSTARPLPPAQRHMAAPQGQRLAGSVRGTAARATTSDEALFPSLPSASPPSASRPSLREMLKEQQQLQDASRKSLAEHTRLMHAAGAVRGTLSSAGESPQHQPRLTPTPPPPPAPPSATVAAPVLKSETKAAAPSAVEADRMERKVEGDNPPGGSSKLPMSSTRAASPSPARAATPGKASLTSTVPHSLSGSVGSGIQVVKFTLPQDGEARQSAVQQLCRSPSGTQHVDSKDRYRAMLASQKDDLASTADKAQSYKELLSRAVQYNTHQQQQHSPSHPTAE